MRTTLAQITNRIAAVCPIHGVSYDSDGQGVAIQFADGLSEDQIKAANRIVSTYDPNAPTSDDINAERDRRLASFTFNGKRFDLTGSETKISGAGTLALASVMTGAAWDANFAWISADNVTVPMDAQTMLDFAKAAADWTARHIHAARAMKNMDKIPADYASDSRWPS